MNNFELSFQRYLFTDLFISNNRIIFISIVYQDDITFDFSLINCFFNNKIYKFTTPYIKLYHEPCVIGILEHDDITNYLKQSNVIFCKIQYKDKHKSFLLSLNPSKPIYNLTIFTLFKDDSYLINSWIEYYLSKGVQHFFLYFNGKLNNIKHIIINFDPKIVTFVEWDYPYYHWYDKPDSYYYKLYNITYVDKHHAQPMAINSCLYRFGPLTKWLAFFDLDEYIVYNDKLPKLLELYNEETTAEIYFSNAFAMFTHHFDKTHLKLSDIQNNIIMRQYVNFDILTRIKKIVNVHNVHLTGIHENVYKKINTNIIMPTHYFFHFYTLSPKNRLISDETPYNIIDKLL